MPKIQFLNEHYTISYCLLHVHILSSAVTSELSFLAPPTAGDGVLSPGECHAASKGAAGTEDEIDPGQHPAAAGGAETHPRAAAESPGTGHTGKM